MLPVHNAPHILILTSCKHILPCNPAEVQQESGKTQITLKVGFSHEIKIPLPSSLLCFSKKPSLFSLYSLDLPEVQQFASKLIAYKKPEPYKGKGLRFQGKVIPLRMGKKK